MPMFKESNPSYSQHDLSGKIAIVFGGSKGLGLKIALQFLQLNAKVYLTIENPILLSATKVDSTAEKLKFIEIDALKLSSVIAGAEQIMEKESKIDILVNCIDTIFLSYEVTKDGFERTLQTNYLAPTLLLNSLLPLLKNSEEARVVNLINDAYRFPQFQIYDFKDVPGTNRFCFLEDYGLSKLYLIALTRELSRRLKSTSLLINCLFNEITTEETDYAITASKSWYCDILKIMFRVVNSITRRNPGNVLEDVLFLTLEPEVHKFNSGQCWSDKQVEDVSESAKDPHLAKSLFSITNLSLNIEW